MSEPIDDILRDAGVVWEPGMHTMGGYRVIAAGGEDVCLSSDPHEMPWWDAAREHAQNIEDPSTYALCLAQLARRLGLDPEQGATFDGDGRIWNVQCAGGRAWTPDIPDTDIDHRRALALALRATAPKGGSNGQE